MRSQNAQLTVIDLIRHGEPEGGRKFRGSTDHPLSEAGWQQMKSAVGHQAPWDIILTSPLLRCKEFAYWLSERHGLKVKEDPRLAELHLGHWEGLTMAEVRELYPSEGQQTDAVSRFWANPLHNHPLGGETLEAFDQRISQAWQAIHEEHAGQRLLIVAHLFTCNLLIRQVLQHPLAKALSFDLPYAALTRIRCESSPAGQISQLEWMGLEQLPERSSQSLQTGR